MKIVHVHCMESYGDYGGIGPLFLNFSSIWRRMVNFVPHLPPGKEPRHTLNRWQGRPQSWYGWFWRKKTIAPSGIWTPDHLTRGLVTTPTTLSRFVWEYFMVLRNTCLWGTFGKQRKGNIKLCRVCPFARIKQLDSHLTNFYR